MSERKAPYVGASDYDPDEAYDREREDRVMEGVKDPDDLMMEAMDVQAEVLHDQGECGPFCQYCEAETTCSLCEREMEKRDLPICEQCEATARAHAKLSKAESDWRKDGSPK